MVELAQGASLPREAFLAVRRAAEQRLQRDRLSRQVVGGAVDGAHAAEPREALDLEALGDA